MPHPTNLGKDTDNKEKKTKILKIAMGKNIFFLSF